jgi:hypothetical protein
MRKGMLRRIERRRAAAIGRVGTVVSTVGIRGAVESLDRCGYNLRVDCSDRVVATLRSRRIPFVKDPLPNLDRTLIVVTEFTLYV